MCLVVFYLSSFRRVDLLRKRLWSKNCEWVENTYHIILAFQWHEVKAERASATVFFCFYFLFTLSLFANGVMLLDRVQCSIESQRHERANEKIKWTKFNIEPKWVELWVFYDWSSSVYTSARNHSPPSKRVKTHHIDDHRQPSVRICLCRILGSPAYVRTVKTSLKTKISVWCYKISQLLNNLWAFLCSSFLFCCCFCSYSTHSFLHYYLFSMERKIGRQNMKIFYTIYSTDAVVNQTNEKKWKYFRS